MPIGAYKLNAISRRGSATTALEPIFYLVEVVDNPNTNTSSALSDAFGATSADLNDTYFIVGTPLEDYQIPGNAAIFNTGVAYVFDTSTRNLIATLVNPYPVANDNFGQCVAVSTSRAIVSDQVSANAYVYSASTGSLLYTFMNPYPGNSDATFADCVDISDSYAVISHAGYVQTGPQVLGRVYIYNATTGSLVHELANPYPPVYPTDSYFGSDVAITDQYTAVSNNANVYVYSNTTGNLVYNIATGVASYIDICNFYVAVGNTNGNVRIYNLSDGSLRNTIVNPNAFASVGLDQFGRDVAISDSYVMVGAALEDSAASTTSDIGINYIFEADTGALVQTLTTPYGNIGQQQYGTGITNRYAITNITVDDPGNFDYNNQILFYSRVQDDTLASYVTAGYVTAGYIVL